MKIHPLFDMEKAEWHCEELGVSAPSIRELKKKLPPRTLVLGYYPNGYRDAEKDRKRNNISPPTPNKVQITAPGDLKMGTLP